MKAIKTYMREPLSSPNPLAYAPRSCLALGVGDAHGVQYKLYAIWSDRFTANDIPTPGRLAPLLVDAFDGWTAPGDHPLGFAIVHLANDGTYLLLLRWNNGNNLRHRVFSLDLAAPLLRASLLDDSHTIACIWEMRLISIEVTAWIDAVLSKSADELTPEIARDYLSAAFTGPL